MAKKVNINDLSNFILAYSNINGISINHHKLQRLLYYIQAWHLVYFDKQTIFDEEAEAWVSGPVYREVYNEIRQNPPYVNLQCITSEYNIEENYKITKSKIDLTDDQWDFLKSILEHYGIMSFGKLIFLTHSELPWNEAREDCDLFDISEKKISLETMYNFYSKNIS